MSYDDECIFIECLEVDTLTGGSTSGVVGNPTPPRVFGPVVGILPTDIVADGLWKLESKLLLLFPVASPALSTFVLSIVDTLYNAYQSNGGALTLNAEVQNNPTGQPTTIIVGPFSDGDTGTLTAMVKNSAGPAAANGSQILTTANDSGTYVSLIIDTDADVVSPSGFFKSLTAHIKAAAALVASNSIQYSYQLTHSVTGNTNIVSFYQDDSITPAVISQSITGISGATVLVSGVPSLSTGSAINTTFTVTNAVRSHFNATAVGLISGSFIVAASQLPSILYRLPGASPIFNFAAVPAANIYTENATVICTGQSSAGQTASATASGASAIRIDTKSIARNEPTIRVTSGTGDFPAAGYNIAFNSATLLTTNEELQLLGGIFRYPPSVNYSTMLPSGPDYSLITTTPIHTYRWVTFNYGIQNMTVIELNVIGGVGLSSVIESWKLEIQLVGGTGPTKWVNGNVAYPGVGNPGAGALDGDAALVIASSTSTKKVITFGTIYYTGVTPIVRVGLPIGSGIQFSSINATFL